jgi:CDP-glucose 4,6-dehydratase
VIDSYRKSFFNPSKFNEHQKSIVVARSGNVIGGGDFSENRLLPDIVKSLENQNTIEVRNPNSVRPWQHVLEAINGYLVLAANQIEHPQSISNAFNFGPDFNEQLTVLDVVKKSIEVWGKGEYVIKNHKSVHEAALLQLDSTRANLELGFIPVYNAYTAIEKSILWYKNAKENSLQFTKQQIKDYIKLINKNK